MHSSLSALLSFACVLCVLCALCVRVLVRACADCSHILTATLPTYFTFLRHARNIATDSNIISLFHNIIMFAAPSAGHLRKLSGLMDRVKSSTSSYLYVYIYIYIYIVSIHTYLHNNASLYIQGNLI